MDVLLDKPEVIFLVIGLLLLGIDIFVIGLSPLLFVAAGSLVTSAILYVAGWESGILHLTGWKPDFLEGLAICAVVSLVLALVGRRPLQAFQAADVEEDKSSDLIGRELVTTEEVTRASGWVMWSGTHWQARLADNVDVDRVGPGVRMKVVEVKNLALVLRPIP
jgi:membrane protein implicated in regulation of membrane protease activity